MSHPTVYFIDIDSTPLERLYMQYLPKRIQQTRSVKLAEVDIVGKSVPTYHVTGGTTEMVLELTGTAELEDRADLMRRLKWLEARTYFARRGKPPHRLQVVFGDMLVTQLWLIKNISIDYGLFQKHRGYLPQEAVATLTLVLWAESEYTDEDVLGSFRVPSTSSELESTTTGVSVVQADANKAAQQPITGVQGVNLADVQQNKNARERLEAVTIKSKASIVSQTFSAGSLVNSII